MKTNILRPNKIVLRDTFLALGAKLAQLWNRLLNRLGEQVTELPRAKRRELGRLVATGNQKLYELNIKTGDLKEPQYKKELVNVFTGERRKRLKTKKGHAYFLSYSKTAAIKKAKKIYLRGY